MKGEDFVSIVRSPAFTVLITTICVVFVMKQLPGVITTIKELKKPD
jgi:hypothetical protein